MNYAQRKLSYGELLTELLCFIGNELANAAVYLLAVTLGTSNKNATRIVQAIEKERERKKTSNNKANDDDGNSPRNLIKTV